MDRRAAAASTRSATGAKGRVIRLITPKIASPAASDGLPRAKWTLSCSAIWMSRKAAASARSRAATSARGGGSAGVSLGAHRAAGATVMPAARSATGSSIAARSARISSSAPASPSGDQSGRRWS